MRCVDGGSDYDHTANEGTDFLPVDSAVGIEYPDTSGSVHHLLDFRSRYSRLVHAFPDEAFSLRPHSTLGYVGIHTVWSPDS